MMSERSFDNILIRTFTTAVTILLAVFYLVYVFAVPDLHIKWYRMSSEILWVDPDHSSNGFPLTTSDRLLQLGEYKISLDYTLPFYTTILSLVTEQQTVPIVIEKNGQVLEGEWPVSSPSGSEILRRIVRFFPVLVFQIAAIFTQLFLRPKDVRWRLLVINFSLGAILLVTGFFANLTFFAADYLCVFIFWAWSSTLIHLTWVYPQPLAPSRPLVWAFMYALGFLLALAEVLGILPPYSFFVGSVGVFLICVTFVLLHLFRPGQRRAIVLFLIGFLVILLILALLAVFSIHTNGLDIITWITFLVLPGLPLAVIFPIARLQMPGVELRANQAFINLLYTAVIAAGALLISIFTSVDLPDVEIRVYYSIFLALMVASASLYLYPSFKRWVQKHLLGIPLTPLDLLQRFSGRISTCSEPSDLTNIITEEILPALMVRQAALFRMGLHGRYELLASCGLTENQIPSANQIPLLLEKNGGYQPPDNFEDSKNSHWVRLVLKLDAADRLVGVCLFGQRDPDDFYSVEEIPMLQSLMDQAALALHNIEQAERLYAYHKSNIQRNEEERRRLARDLHDDVLGQLALIQMNLPGGSESDEFHTAFDTAVSRVRGIMNGLRPTMLEYGLKPALDQLVDDLLEQVPSANITINLCADDNPRFPREVETHIFRIIQEACQNALRHGQARHIIVYGTLAPGDLCLDVIDNGKGFKIEKRPDLQSLLKKGHYGLVNIYERAQIIGASVDILSNPGKGTHIRVEWRASP